MTYREICDAFRRAGIETPEWDAQLLAERFCRTDRLSLLSDPNRDLHAPLLGDAVRRRCAREPLQYLLGEWEFYRQRYEISPDCLIPRADTEILVEEAVKRLPKGAFFADLCTGSGCIAVSVLAERPDTRALAVELSPRALELAERNARRNGVSERFSPLQADVLHFSSHLHPRPHAILSNPPYIRSEIVPTLPPEVQKEPRMALDGGEDGLIFYRALVKLAREWLDDGGFCLFEIGFDQGDAITELAAREGFSCTLRQDYGGCDRVAILDIK
ncbi:MAG: peptide chain release factor N(5)-glutamine methyltransferase [Clostridia bacterium]|nr:peptide chain release factor N(5)-glutamine methyltransferase [Clostridia bacterium]